MYFILYKMQLLLLIFKEFFLLMSETHCDATWSIFGYSNDQNKKRLQDHFNSHQRELKCFFL